MTSSCCGAIAVVVDHVASAGSSREARRAYRRWADLQPDLAGFGSPASVAAACRAARGADQDRLIAAVLGVAAGDGWAQLTVLAGVAGRLGWVVAGWARAGVAPSDVADLESELVAACWAAIVAAADGDSPPPDRPGLVLVDRAWSQVRTGRRRQRRHDTHDVPLPADLPAAARDGRPVLEVLAGEVTGAVTSGRLGLRPARAVYLTRVAGWSTIEAGGLLGCGAASLRTLRARAEHALAA